MRVLSIMVLGLMVQLHRRLRQQSIKITTKHFEWENSIKIITKRPRKKVPSKLPQNISSGKIPSKLSQNAQGEISPKLRQSCLRLSIGRLSLYVVQLFSINPTMTWNREKFGGGDSSEIFH